MFRAEEIRFMRMALRLAQRGYGQVSPNPMVGAVVVKGGKVLGQGWHHRAGDSHAEIEALRDVQRQKHSAKGATLYVTLEPCSTQGRTPPCTEAIQSAGIQRLIVAATDPNPAHAGRGFGLLRRAGLAVRHGLLSEEATRLNEAFNHWIVHRTPFVTVKAAMTLDGKIATAGGDAKWITGPAARAEGMRRRAGVDAILVGVNTIRADDPRLTIRGFAPAEKSAKKLRRLVLDSQARTPLRAQVVSDEFAPWTTIVVGPAAPEKRVRALAERVEVWRAPMRKERLDVRWVLKRLGEQQVTSLLVEGGGEVNASFLFGQLTVGSSRVDLQACKLEYSIVSPK